MPLGRDNTGVTAVQATRDEQIAERVRADDADALAELFVRDGPAVFRYAFRRTADRAEAEDVLSIVFLELWRTRERMIAPKGRALPWLLGIARNVLARERADRQRHALLLQELRRNAPGLDDDDPTDRLEAEERMRRVRGALAILGRREREVIELCVWAGLSSEEAAVALGISPVAVRLRLSRARRRLATLVAATRQSVPESTGGDLVG
jgi:RNA polymerase sigma-70 factor, ECF subfamily